MASRWKEGTCERGWPVPRTASTQGARSQALMDRADLFHRDMVLTGMSHHLAGQRDVRLSYQHFARLPERRADDTGNAAMGGNQSDGGIGLDRWGNTGAAVRHTPLIIRAAPAHGHPCHHPSGT